MDELLDPLIRFAQEMLEKHGQFYPFGMQMTSVGEVTMAAAYTRTEHPSSQELIDLLHEGMRRHADNGAPRAAGICYDVRIHSAGGEGVTDAIR